MIRVSQKSYGNSDAVVHDLEKGCLFDLAFPMAASGQKSVKGF